MKGIFLLLGSNLGDRLQNLKQAASILEAHEMSITDYSSLFESAPWGNEDQPWFYNMVLRIDTIHSPEKLLQCCLDSENQMGRKRHKKWGERIIDIDILYYNNETIETDKLTIPHPGIPMRRFTLMPLAEIAPDETHPLLNQTNSKLLNICPDQLECKKSETDISL